MARRHDDSQQQHGLQLAAATQAAVRITNPPAEAAQLACASLGSPGSSGNVFKLLDGWRHPTQGCATHFWLASHTSLMLEKRWWCSVLVMVSLSSAEFLNMRIRISRLCRYECSEEMSSNMA